MRHGQRIGLLWAAFAVRVFGLGSQSVWFDEGWSAYAAAQPSLVAAINADTTNPPLYYVLLYLTAPQFGESTFALRYVSLLLGMLIIPLAARLADRILPSASTVVVGLLAFSAPLVWASQEMRMYTLLAVLVLWAALAFERLRHPHPPWHVWAGLLIAETALLYSHNTGPAVVLWLNAAVGIGWLVGGGRGMVSPLRGSAPNAQELARRKRLKRLRPNPLWWLAGQALVGLLYAPWFVARFLLVAGANSALVRRTPPSFDIWEALWVAPWAAVGDMQALTRFAAVALAIFLITVPLRKVGWVLLHAALLTLSVLLGLAVLGNELHGRYLVMVVPLVLIAQGVGLARIPRPQLRFVLLMVFIAGYWLNAFIVGTVPGYRHDDARGMVAHYANTLTAVDSVVAWSYADRYDLRYYWERQNVAAARVTLPEGADLDAVLPLLPTGGDISLNVWYTQRADYRGMLPCLLGHGTTSPPEQFTTNGMTTLTYRAPQIDASEFAPVDAAFTVAENVQAAPLPTDFTANMAACVPVRLTTAQPISAELKAAVAVLNPLGDVIAQADAIFANARQQTTADLSATGETLTAYPLLRLPLGTPPGEYAVTLRLYDEIDAVNGYDVLVDGSAAGKDTPLGTWRVVPGAVWQHDDTRVGLLSADMRVFETGEPLYNGDVFTLDFLWRGEVLPLTLRALDGAWSVEIPPSATVTDNLTRDWRAVQIPLDATAGLAEVAMPDGQTVWRITVMQRPIIVEPPSVDVEVGALYPGIGELVGYRDLIDTADGLQVTLVWRAAADAPPSTDYTVFVQSLSGGEVRAQSDRQPANGDRPTSGWRPGEYIVDTHTLPGEAGETLIAGLYTPAGRIRTAAGVDAVMLLQP